MKLLASLDLNSKYVRHGIVYYCHNHPSEQDNFNAALKDLVAALQNIDWVEVNGAQISAFGQQNLVFNSGLATIVVTVLNDGTHDIQASDIYGHLYSSDHVHFTQAMIDHYNLQNVGSKSHDDIDSALALLDPHLYTAFRSHGLTAPGNISIASPSLTPAMHQGLPCVKTEDDTQIGLKISIDADTFWRNAERYVLLELGYLDEGTGSLQGSWYSSGGNQSNLTLNTKENSGRWIYYKSIIGMTRTFGEFTSNGNADILIRGTDGIALNLIRFGLADDPFNPSPFESNPFCEWRAAV